MFSAWTKGQELKRGVTRTCTFDHGQSLTRHHIIDFEGCAMHKGVFGKCLVQHPTLILNQMKCSRKLIPKVNEDRP